MKKWFLEYIHSFRLGFDFWATFLIDFMYLGLCMMIFTWFLDWLKNRSQELLQNKTLEEVQAMMASAHPEQSLVFLASLKNFLWLAIGGVVFLVVAAGLLYSLSRAVIWYHLLGKKWSWKNYGKWNVFNLVLIIPLLFYGLFYFIGSSIAALLIKWLITLIPSLYFKFPAFFQGFTTFVNSFVSFSYGLGALMLLFLLYYTFATEYVVWASIGKAFHVMRLKKKQLARVFWQALLTTFLLALAAMPLRSVIQGIIFLSVGFDLMLFCLFVAWLRLGVWRVLEEN